MNLPASVERGWSPGRWVGVIVFLFLVQALLAWRLSDPSPLVVREESRKLSARLAPASLSPDLAALLELNNPTLFVLPARDGFSGRAWMAVKPLEHRSPGWSNPPQWLALKPERLLLDLDRFGATNQPERAAVSDRLSRPQPGRAPMGADFQIPLETRVTVSGEVGPADLVSALDFPVLDHAGILAPSVVSMLVDQRGRVFQVSLAPGGSSGLPAADRLALETVRRLQFVLDPRISASRDARDFEQLRRGQVTVRWRTRPPAPATNAPPVTPVVPTVPLQ